MKVPPLRYFFLLIPLSNRQEKQWWKQYPCQMCR